MFPIGVVRNITRHACHPVPNLVASNPNIFCWAYCKSKNETQSKFYVHRFANKRDRVKTKSATLGSVSFPSRHLTSETQNTSDSHVLIWAAARRCQPRQLLWSTKWSNIVRDNTSSPNIRITSIRDLETHTLNRFMWFSNSAAFLHTHTHSHKRSK